MGYDTLSLAKPSILICFGTRPEVIKLAPVIAELRRRLPEGCVTVLSTGQQSALLEQALGTFGLTPDIRLEWNGHGRSLAEGLSQVVRGVGREIGRTRPDLVVVQGDTLSSYGAALAAFYAGTPLAHVEAGLRTHDLREPFPEEMHRQAIARLATLHLAPTADARRNLLAEHVAAETIVVTGNTGQDALRMILPRCAVPSIDGFGAGSPYAVVTVHRRENSARVAAVARGLREGVSQAGTSVVVVLHPNPAVSTPMREALEDVPGVVLSPPLDMEHMVGLCRGAQFLLTDSGGLQEEATALGVPCLVLRTKTDRPESVACGTARIVGTNARDIAAAFVRLATDSQARARMLVAADVYGDGTAARASVDAMLRLLDRTQEPP